MIMIINENKNRIAAARKNGEQYLLVICEMSSCLAKGEGPSGSFLYFSLFDHFIY